MSHRIHLIRDLAAEVGALRIILYIGLLYSNVLYPTPTAPKL